MQPRRWGVTITRSTIGLQLVDPVQRHVEAVATFVLYDRNLERRTIGPQRDRLQPTIDADPVLEMHDVPARRQRP